MTKTEEDALRRQLENCQGNVTVLAAEMGVARQVLASRLKAAGLDEHAAQQRAIHGVSGTRASLRKGCLDPEGERAQIVRALDLEKSQVAAARYLGIHRRRLQRAMERLGIKP